MEKTTPNRFHKFLRLEFNQQPDIWLSSTHTLRKLIGILGIALPFLLIFFLSWDTGYFAVLPSISHYYYTRVDSLFILVMVLLSVFLIIYKGDDPVEFYASSIAGIFALCVVFFPTGNLCDELCDKLNAYCIFSNTHLKSDWASVRVPFHFISAAIFLLALAYMSFVLFSRRSGQATGKTVLSSKCIHRMCAIIMVVAMLIVMCGEMEWIPPAFYTAHHGTFWMETIAVISFGFSWLLAGRNQNNTVIVNNNK